MLSSRSFLWAQEPAGGTQLVALIQVLTTCRHIALVELLYSLKSVEQLRGWRDGMAWHFVYTSLWYMCILIYMEYGLRRLFVPIMLMLSLKHAHDNGKRGFGRSHWEPTAYCAKCHRQPAINENQTNHSSHNSRRANKFQWGWFYDGLPSSLA